MTCDWGEVKQLFGDALALAPDARAEFVRSRCEGRTTLQSEVLALLDNASRAGGFLREPSVHRDGAGTPSPADVPIEGQVLAGRYLLRKPLGSGGGGTVYLADDLLRGTTVAAKLLRGFATAALEGIRREVAMLRLLRLPGVVHLIDDGIHEGGGFIVMECVDGTPFPAKPSPCDWSEIENTVLGLLDTLSNIHWAGVIHCDLKPDNILVGASGVPTVLDLGVSAWLDSDPLTRDGDCLFGTLRYMAPERLLGGAPSVRSDLFSVGVMIYRALANRFPLDHQEDVDRGLTFDPSPDPAPPLESVAPAVPPHVAQVVDRLVSVNPADRPESAAEARRGMQASSAPHGRARYTDFAVLDAALDALRGGRSIRVAGADGSGRSRLLADVARRLAMEGRTVVELVPADHPFGSLAPLFDLGDERDTSIDEARGIAQTCVRDALKAGAVLLADGVESMDPESVRALDECANLGAVLRIVRKHEAHDAELTPATPEELEQLFAGPNRVHHLREDAARELWRRTSGVPATIDEELRAWVRSGLARRDGDRLVISRPEIERLRIGLRAFACHAADLPDDLPLSTIELLECADIAGGEATIELLAHATDRPRWQVESELQRAEERGVISRRGQRVVLLSPTAAGRDWSRDQRARVHQRIASELQPGCETRLFHLIAGDRLEELGTEVPVAAQAQLRAGRTDRAFTTLTEGLAAIRRADLGDFEASFLRVMLQAGLKSGTTTALDATLYHLARCPEPFPMRPVLESIARAALATLQGDALRAQALLGDETVGDDPELTQSIWAVRVVASSYTSVEHHEQVVEAAAAWALDQAEPEIHSAAYDWLGWLRYRQLRFDEAAELHARSAALAESTIQAAVGNLNAAWAALDGGRFDHVESLVRTARLPLASVRHAHLESRAELLARSARYRSGATLVPDRSLVRATRRLGVSHIHGLVTLNESAIAWRGDDTSTARELAEEAAQSLRDANVPLAALLAESLAHLCGSQPQGVDLEARAAQAAGCPLPAAAVQILALLQKAFGLSNSWRERALARTAELPPSTHGTRREVLSIDECVRWLRMN